MAPYKLAKDRFGGEFWLVQRVGAIDEFPKLLESRLPIFHAWEAPILKAFSDAALRTFIAGRNKALDDERRLRASDKRRTVHGPAGVTDPECPANAVGATETGDLTGAVA